MTDQTFIPGVQQTLSANTFYKTDSMFKGWATSPNAAVLYANQQEVTISNDMVLYAIWSDEDDYGNTFSDAFNWGVLGSGVNSRNGNIEYSKDIDMFKFTAPVTGTYTFSTSNLASSIVYLDIWLYGSDQKLMFSRLASYNNATVSLQYSLNSGQECYLMLDGYSGTGTYTVNISVPASVEYILSYNANGGAGAPAQQTNPTYVAASMPATPKSYMVTYNTNGGNSISPDSKQVQCTFRNWNTNASGTGVFYEPGAPYTSGVSATLYAQWNNPAAGELPTPTWNEHGFKGWFTAASGGTPVTPSTIITDNMTLYAVWSDYSFVDDYGNTFDEAYNWDLLSGTDTMYACINYAKDIDMFKFTANVSGTYTFSTGNLASSIVYLDIYLYNGFQSLLSSKLAMHINSTVSFQYSLSAGQTYYLRADGHSGTGTYTISISAPVSTEYILSYDANGGAGAPAQQINPTHVTASKPTTYKYYTITFDSNGGYSVPGPNWINCTFINWNTNASGTGTFYESGAIYPSGVSATLYAQWNNPAVGELPTPTRSGWYDFKGWYTAATGGTLVTPFTIITGNTTVYAQWEPSNIFTVAFDPNGGTGTMADQTFISGVPQALSANAFFKAGYNFIGWTISPTGSPIYKDRQVLQMIYYSYLYAAWDDYGDTFEEAFDWQLLPGVNSRSGTIDYLNNGNDDQDVLKFTAPTTGTYTCFITNQAKSTGTLQLFLTNDSYIPITNVRLSTANVPVSFECNLVAGQVYYVGLIPAYGLAATGLGSYTINITVP
jgi:uncharacterized repeat protein (TIGR02543 family)